MRRKVLVVEDDPDQLEVTRMSLKAAGFAIGTASNGIDALKKAQTVSPDLILLDILMLEWTGSPFAKLCGRIPPLPPSGSHADRFMQSYQPACRV